MRTESHTLKMPLLKVATALVAVAFITLGLGPANPTVNATTVDDSDFPGEIGSLPEALAGMAAARNDTSGIIYLFPGENQAVGVASDYRHNTVSTCQSTQLGPNDDHGTYGIDDNPGALDGSIDGSQVPVVGKPLCDGEIPVAGGESPVNVNQSYDMRLVNEACVLGGVDPCPVNPYVDYGDQSTTYTDLVYAYDPADGTFVVVEGADFPEGGAGWNSAVWYEGAAYIFGGFRNDNGVGEPTSNIYKFTPGPNKVTGATEILDAELAFPAHGVASCVVGSNAFLFGGNEGPLGYTEDPAGFYDQYHNETYVFDLQTETMSPLPVAYLPQPAYGHACAYDADDDTVVLLGGKFHGEEAWANTTLHFNPNTYDFTRYEPHRETTGGSSVYGDFGDEVYRQGSHMAAFYNDVTGTVHVAGGYGYYLNHKKSTDCGPGPGNGCIVREVGPYPWISRYNTASQTGLDDEGELTDAVFGAAAVYDSDTGYAYIFGGKSGRGNTHSDQVVRFQTHLHETLTITDPVSTDFWYGSAINNESKYYRLDNNTHQGTFTVTVDYAGTADDLLDVTVSDTQGWMLSAHVETINTSTTVFPYDVVVPFDPSTAGIKAGATVLEVTVASQAEPDLTRTGSADIVIPLTIFNGLTQYSGYYSQTEPVIVNVTLRYFDGSPAAGVIMTITETQSGTALDVAGVHVDRDALLLTADGTYHVVTRDDGQAFLDLGNPRYNPNGESSALKAMMPGPHQLTFKINDPGYDKMVCHGYIFTDGVPSCPSERHGPIYPWNYHGSYSGYVVYDGTTGAGLY